MTVRIRAHFDGKVIVPDEPVALPVNTPLEAELTMAELSAEEIEPRLEALHELVAHAVHGVGLPNEAVSREGIYDE